MWEDTRCKAPITRAVIEGRKIEGKVKEFKAEWSEEYKMWIAYPILHYSDGTKKDASGQIIL
jgi:hypothetical protein